MLTLRAAATRLATCDSPDGLRELLALLGFGGVPLPVTADLLPEAGSTAVHRAEILSGTGALRALAVELADGADAQRETAALARTLAGRAPHVLWLIASVQQAPPTLTLVVPGAAGAATALLVNRTHVVDSDGETLLALVAAAPRSGIDVLAHTRWHELLGREALNRRFYVVLEQHVRSLSADAIGGRSAEERDEAALLCASRLLFLAFLEAKGWLDRDRAFLLRVFDDCMTKGGRAHDRLLRPLFFGTLNTPRRSRAAVARHFGDVPFLNGGLFAPARVERGRRSPRFTDGALGGFLQDVLGRYRFTAREDAATWSESAVDPEMLGRAFESLMAHRDRRTSGTFYTPSRLVERVADAGLLGALERLLPAGARRALGDIQDGATVSRPHQQLVRDALGQLTVLDPACGSGAFLVHALERLARWRTLAGDDRSGDAIRRELLATSIFGVDRDPTAVWLCELRLWLAASVESQATDPAQVVPLPNLDRNIRVGDALGALVDTSSSDVHPTVRRTATRVAELRMRYARATGVRKLTAARTLDAAERAAALARLDWELDVLDHRRRDLIAARRSRDLFGRRATSTELDRDAQALRVRAAGARQARRRLLAGGALPFRYDAHFADVFARGGFASIVGNPPWVRIHRIPPGERVALRERFTVMRHAAWMPGAAAGGAGAGFSGQADLAALFVERSLALLRPHGTLAMLVPAKLWTALAGGGVRQLLTQQADVVALEDCSDAPEQFDAVTYPSIVVAEKREPGGGSPRHIEATVHRGGVPVRWSAPASRLPFDDSPGSPWLLLPPPVRDAFDRLRRCGTLGDAGFTRPVMGVKCGCNDAFIVTVGGDADDDAICAAPMRLAHVRDAAGRRGVLEPALLRPLLRGEQVRAWRPTPSAERIIWTHDDRGVLRELPPHAARWLAPHRGRLVARSDSRGHQAWWTIHRTEAAQLHRARVVWADVARTPRALWLEPGDSLVPLNTCYVLHCRSTEDAQALAALMNSALAAAWLWALAEPARGGYRRLFAWTTALLPLPADWARARALLAPLARRAACTDGSLSPAELLDAVITAYRVRRRDVVPLLEWHAESRS